MTALPRLTGATRVPGDKSIAHRALLLAGMAGSDSTISGLPDGRDVASTRRCLEALGVVLDGGERTVRVRPPAEWRPGRVLDAGNSGTTARLLAGALAARRCAATIEGDASLSRRPMERVAAPLRALGAAVETTEGRLPMRIRGVGLAPASWTATVSSAQVKSAFLLAATGVPGDSAYREAWATRDHLERMLPAFGVPFLHDEAGWLHVRGGRPTGTRLGIPGDPSSAAAVLAAAALLPGSDVVVEGVGVNPLRMGFASVLERMGAPVEAAPERREPVAEPVADLRLRAPEGLVGVHVGAHETPGLVDELPLLLLLAAFAEGESRFDGLAELRLKESDRLKAMTDLFEGLGVPHEVQGDSLVLRGGAAVQPCPVDANGDHRIAMVHSILALRLPGQPDPRDPCVDVSWPAFHEKLAMLAR